MQKTFLFSLAMIWACQTIKAQQEPLNSNYTHNILSFNPAFAGSKRAMVVSALYNKQFTALESGTVTQNFALHAPINHYQLGIGAHVYSIKQDVFTTSVYNADVSYKIKAYKGFLSTGMSFGFYQQKIDRHSLQIHDPSDPFLKDGNTFYTHPDLGAGLFYSDPKNALGFSVQHLLFSTNSNKQDLLELNRHYYGFLSRKISLSHNSALQLASKLRYTQGALFQSDLSAYYLCKDVAKVGLSYRTIGAVSFQMSMALRTILSQIKSTFFLAYAYDHSLKNYQQYTKGSHELILLMELASLKRPGNDKPVISPLMY